MKKKLLGILLTAVLVVCAFTICVSAEATTINTADELIALMNTTDPATDWAKDYVLGGNIALPTDTEVYVQTPIGTKANPFTGEFDGDGYTISGLAINSEANFAGLFGYVEDATIENLKVSGSVTSSMGYAGGIVGVAQSPFTIKNCESAVTVTSTGSDGMVGGVVGIVHFNDSGSEILVENCTNSGAVSGYAYVGGVVGILASEFGMLGTDANAAIDVSNSTLTIRGCVNYGVPKTTTGNVSGGILGYVRYRSNTGTNYLNVEKCANYAVITTPTTKAYTGGIIGAIYESANNYYMHVTVKECLNSSTFSTSTSSSARGALIGEAKAPKGGKGSLTVSDCKNEKSGLPMVGLIGAASTAYNMTIERVYNEGGAKIVNALTDVNSTSTLAPATKVNLTLTDNCVKTSTAEEIAALAAKENWINVFGSAELEEFSLISTPEELSYLMTHNKMWAGNYKLGADIDLTGYTQAPIGNNSVTFTGSFDGDGHTVSGVNIKAAAGTLGFFGKVKNVSIANLTVRGKVTSTKGDYIGGLVAHFVDGGTIDNCVVDLEVSAATNGAAVGGIIGCVEHTTADGGTLTITNTVNMGDVVQSYRYTGGFIGLLKTTTAANCPNKAVIIENCVNFGDINAAAGNCVGGFVGLLRHAGTAHSLEFTINKCANYGDVYSASTGDGNVGGIIGEVLGAAGTILLDLTVTEVYSEGNIHTTGKYAGGIIGYIMAPKLDENGAATLTFSDWMYNGENTEVGLVGRLSATACTWALTRAYNAVGEKILIDDTTTQGSVTVSSHTVTLTDCYNSASQDFTNLLANENWTTFKNAPYLAEFAPDTSIDSAEEFIALMSDPTLWDEDLTLTADIDIANFAQSSIGTLNAPFTGSFDGKNHKISGINISGDDNVGLFGVARGAEFKDLTLEGTVTATGQQVSALVGLAFAPFTAQNITSNVAISNSGGKHAGAIVGMIYFDTNEVDALISKCTNNANIISGSYAGGIIGVAGRYFSTISYVDEVDCHSNDLTVTGCVNMGDITIDTANVAGGIMGYYMFRKGGDGVSYFKLLKSANHGAIKGTGTEATTKTNSSYIGGIIGAVLEYNSGVTSELDALVDIELAELYNAGTIAATSTSFMGSIVSLIRVPTLPESGVAPTSVHDCWNTSVSAYGMVGYVGGVACTWNAYNLYNTIGKYVIMKQTTLTGEVTANSNTITLTNCFNSESAVADALAALVTTTDETDESCKWVNRFDAPELKEFAQEKIEVTLDNIIDSEEELVLLMNSPERWNESYTLGANLDLEDCTLSPIGTTDNPFTGTFTGTGYTISNMNMSMSGVAYLGLFGSVNNATITDVTLVDATVSGTANYVSALVANAEGKTSITNCSVDAEISGAAAVGMILANVNKVSTYEITVTGCTTSGSVTGTKYVGGMLGRAYANKSLTVTNCTNSATVEATGGAATDHSDAGGIVGRLPVVSADGTVTITGCSNSGSVNGNYVAGGILGEITSYCSHTANISGNTNTGTVETLYYGGGIIGQINNYFASGAGASTATITASNNTNTGNVDADTKNAGGIIGCVANNQYTVNLTLENCENTGTISGAEAVGGFIGYVHNNTGGTASITVNEADNGGEIVGETHVGGLIGYCHGDDSVTTVSITNAENTGNVSGTYNMGGLIGKAYANPDTLTLEITGAKNSGTIKGGDRVGGLIGFWQTASSNATLNISDSENRGTVKGAMIIGGIIGRMEFGGYKKADGSLLTTESNVENVANYGAVTVDKALKVAESTYNGKYAGGIVGLATTTGNKVAYNNIYNEGAVHSTDAYSGGVFGLMRTYGNAGTGTNTAASPIFTLSNAYNCGLITSDGVHVGGLVAFVANTAPAGIANSASKGNVTGTGTTHAFFGCLDETSTVKHVISNAFYAGSPVDPRATAAGLVNDYTAFDTELWMIPVASFCVPELKAYHTCETVWYQVSDGTYSLGCICGSTTVTTAAETPVVYVAQTAGVDTNDGLTAATAVKTLDEAVTRLAKTGGDVIIAERYEIRGNLNLPAWEKQITFTTNVAADAIPVTGFVFKNHGQTINMNGPAKFERIIFDGSNPTAKNNVDSGYYNIAVFAANWNDLTMGDGIIGYGVIFLAAGSNGVSEKSLDLGGKTVNITLNGITSRDIVDEQGQILNRASMYYDRVYLGDRIRNDNSYTVKNVHINFTGNNASFNDFWLATVSNATSDAQMENYTVTANFNGTTDSPTEISTLRTGDRNTMDGTACLTKLELNFNGATFVSWLCELANVKELVMKISTSEELGMVRNRSIGVTASSKYSTPSTVDISFGTHSFAKNVGLPTYASVYTVIEHITDECEGNWGEWEITTEAAPGGTGIKTRTCSVCGLTEDMEYSGICIDHNYVVTLDNRYYCSNDNEIVAAPVADTIIALSPATAKDGKVTVDVTVKAEAIWSALFKIDAPAGFELVDVTSTLDGDFAFAGATEIALPYSMAIMGTATGETGDVVANSIDEVVVTLTFNVTDDIEGSVHVFTLSLDGAYDADGEEIAVEVVSAEVFACTHADTTVTTTADCCNAGVKTTVCNICGNTLETVQEDALGHDWNEGEVVSEMTSTTPGIIRYTCQRCGEIRDDITLPAGSATLTAVAGKIVDGKVSVEIRLDADAVAAVLFTVDASAGLTLESISDNGSDSFYLETSKTVGMPCQVMLVNLDGSDVALDNALVATLEFTVDEDALGESGEVILAALESINAAEADIYMHTVNGTVVHNCKYECVFVADTAEKAAHYLYTCTVCGDSYEEVAVAEEYTASYGSTVILESDLGLQIVANVADKITDASKIWLVVESTDANGNVKREVVNPYQAYPSNKEEGIFIYRFNATRISAKNIADDVSVTLCVEKDGVKYQAPTVNSSIITYYAAAKKANAPAAIMKALDAMMNYGAAAQEYFNYNTANLATTLTGTTKIDYTTDTSVSVNASTTYGDENITTYTYKSLSAILEDKVVMVIKYHGAAIDGLVFKGSYKDINGNDMTFEKMAVVKNGVVTVEVDAIAAKDLRQAFTGALYNGEEQVSSSITTSFEAYATQAINDYNVPKLNAVCRAALAYSDAAADYFRTK